MKYFRALLKLSAAFVCAAAFLAASAAAMAAEPADLVFSQEKSGKYIYCNNVESITANDLADLSNQSAKFIMNNENLEPDRYVFFGAFINRTNTVTGGVSSGKKGFDIDVDVLFNADSDTRITISRLGFEVPQHSFFFLDGVQYSLENEWGGFGCWASYLGLPIKQLDSGNVYEPQPFEAVTFTLKKGETKWLSEFIADYKSVPLSRSVHILADLTIDSGECDIDVAALRSTGTPGDRSNFNPNSSFGSYIRERQYKGISDGLNEVRTELSYTIDDSFLSGASLPVTVYNHYMPDGNTINSWYTQLNPRADEWSYDLCAESDMLKFVYYDPAKSGFYGASVKDRNDYYVFDTEHTDFAAYDKSYGDSKSKYEPNRLLRDKDERKFSCNLGNYGVIYNYDIEITNTGNKKRYLIYKLATSSNNLVYVKDEDGNIINNRILAKGKKYTRISDDMTSLALPAQSTRRYTICVILTANYSGGMLNTLTISDYQTPVETYETQRGGIEKDGSFTGREYYSWSGGTLNLSDDGESWRTVSLPKTVLDGIEGNLNEYRLVFTGSGYTLRPSLYDAGAFYFIDYMYRDMYLLDESFNLIAKQTFGGYPQGYSCANGVHYVKINNTAFRSTTAFRWWDVTDMSMPCWNYGAFSLLCDEGAIKLSTDGMNFYEVYYTDFKPEYVDEYCGYYYYADGRTLYLSRDGLYWRYIVFNGKVTAFKAENGEIIANGAESRPAPIFNDTVALKINDRFISQQTEALLIDNSPYIPLRSAAELMGYSVEWNGGSVTVKKDGEAAQINDISVINDISYVPLRVFSLDMGCKVSYDGISKTADIKN